METPAAASGAATATRIPVRSKSSGPATSKAIHPGSASTPSGTRSVAHTTPSSPSRRTAAAIPGPEKTQDGGGAPGERRTTDSDSGRTRRDSDGAMRASLPGCAPMSDPDWPSALARMLDERGLPATAAPRLAALLKLVRDDPTAPTTVTDPIRGVAAHVAD